MYRVEKDGISFYVSDESRALIYEENGYQIDLIPDTSAFQKETENTITVTGVGKCEAPRVRVRQ